MANGNGNGLSLSRIAALIGIFLAIGGVWVRLEVTAAETRQAIALQPSPVVNEQRLGRIEQDIAVIKAEVRAIAR